MIGSDAPETSTRRLVSGLFIGLVDAFVICFRIVVTMAIPIHIMNTTSNKLLVGVVAVVVGIGVDVIFEMMVRAAVRRISGFNAAIARIERSPHHSPAPRLAAILIVTSTCVIVDADMSQTAMALAFLSVALAAMWMVEAARLNSDGADPNSEAS